MNNRQFFLFYIFHNLFRDNKINIVFFFKGQRSFFTNLSNSLSIVLPILLFQYFLFRANNKSPYSLSALGLKMLELLFFSWTQLVKRKKQNEQKITTYNLVDFFIKSFFIKYLKLFLYMEIV